MNIDTGGNSALAAGSRQLCRSALLAVLGLLPLAAGLPALAADAGSDQPIVASLNPPPQGLSCDQAAAATSVYFQFANPPFQISQLSLYLDGKGVGQDAIDEHWPTVTMKSGLHAGTNTVDIVANGDNGQHIERRMVVQIGGSASNGAGVAQVSCNDAVAQAPQAVPQQQVPLTYDDGSAPPPVADQGQVTDEPPEPVVVEQSPPVVYEQPAPVVYDYPAPVYVYNPYPVVAIDPWVPFVPLFGFGFFYSHYHPWYSPPHVVVNNYYHGGGWGGGYHGGGWNGGGGGWHGPGPGNGGWRGNPGWSGGRGPYPAPGGNSGWHGAPQQPAYNNAPRPGAANGGFRPPGPNGGYRPAPAPRQPAAGQRPQSYWQGGGRQFAAMPQYRPQQNFQSYRPVQQYRPAPQQSFRPAQAAPQFHGGGGGGGGFHGGGGGGFHAAPSGGHGGGGGGRHH